MFQQPCYHCFVVLHCPVPHATKSFTTRHHISLSTRMREVRALCMCGEHLRALPHDAHNIAQNMTCIMSGICYIHECEQAKNMVNMPSNFSFKMVQTQLRTCLKHYDGPHESTAGIYCRHVRRGGSTSSSCYSYLCLQTQTPSPILGASLVKAGK